MSIKYKHNEAALLREMMEYINGTYNEHYAGEGDVQAADLIEAAGHGISFYLGNVIKYSARYGKKAGYNRKDIIKIIHYAFLALHEHDKEHHGETE